MQFMIGKENVSQVTDMHLFWLLMLVSRNNGESSREYSHSRTKC